MAGRPLKFQSIEEFNSAVQKYFDSFSEGGVNERNYPTISGLAYALDVCTQTLINYTEKNEFFAPIKRAKQLVEIIYEQKLHGNNSTGAIFALKNFGWKDKSEQEISGKGGGAIQYQNVTENDKAIIDQYIKERINNEL